MKREPAGVFVLQVDSYKNNQLYIGLQKYNQCYTTGAVNIVKCSQSDHLETVITLWKAP